MFFTLAVSATTAAACDDLVRIASQADPRTMPIPGPARVVWRAADSSAAVLRWGDPAPPPGAGVTSHAGTIWTARDPGPAVLARTSITRVDPVYVARAARGTRALVLSDRASWAAAATGRLGDPDPFALGALLNLGFPIGNATPFAGVSALGGDTSLRVTSGVAAALGPADPPEPATGVGPGAARVAEALVAAVSPLREAGAGVELSLTGGKDSRLIAAVLHAAGIELRARTHGFPGHPDVIVASLVAGRLGIEHAVTEPAVTESAGAAVQEVDVLSRLRASVLVADGMLSAFENLGRPDPAAGAAGVTAGGHGGELLRGGYAQTVRDRGAAASAELLRRLALRRLRLLRPGHRAAYAGRLAPWAAAVARRPHQALDDFYLANRAGRWSAAARQAYAIRSTLVQPLFDHRVVRAARAVPLDDRMSDRLLHGVISELCPSLADVPLAGKRWEFDKAQPPEGPGREAWLARAPVPAPRGGRAAFDWRRAYGEEVGNFLREYVLDQGGAGGLFSVVNRAAAERMLGTPQGDPAAVWALATLAALVSRDWKNARDAPARTFEIAAPR